MPLLDAASLEKAYEGTGVWSCRCTVIESQGFQVWRKCPLHAAAFLLLEALERIMSRYDSRQGFRHYKLDDIDMARAAIAQAKGKWKA